MHSVHCILYTRFCCACYHIQENTILIFKKELSLNSHSNPHHQYIIHFLSTVQLVDSFPILLAMSFNNPQGTYIYHKSISLRYSVLMVETSTLTG